MKQHHPAGRFVDLQNPPKPRWRDVLLSLVAPATRMHRYRNIRAAAFNDVLGEIDCNRKS